MTHTQHSWKRKNSANGLYRNSWLRHRTRLLIVGFGDVAHKLANHLGSRVHIIALSRHRPTSSSLPTSVSWKTTDLDTRTLGCFPRSGYIGMIYLAPPPSHGSEDPRISRLLAQIHVKQVVYISTTGVYGDQGGRWIDETQPVAPRSARAQRRVYAERCLRRWGKTPGQRAMILRAPGIYGSDRLPLDRLQKGTPALREEEDVYTNHIHVEDLARLAWWTLFRGRAQRIYNACDATSMKMGDYFDTVAKATGLPSPPRISRVELMDAVSPMQRSFMEESRRLHSHRIRDELHFVHRYPDLNRWLELYLGHCQNRGG